MTLQFCIFNASRVYNYIPEEIRRQGYGQNNVKVLLTEYHSNQSIESCVVLRVLLFCLSKVRV